MKLQIKECLELLKSNAPLVHCITNYVTVNDCANALLAVGASPVMADDKREVADITSICNGLLINIGTLNERTVESMVIAGLTANQSGIPVVLDPVGVGASDYRRETAFRLLKEVKFAAIRGNISEMMVLACGVGASAGVDARLTDAINEKNLPDLIALFSALSRRIGAVIAISGETDLILDAKLAVLVRNGHHLMPRITGSGCMLGALTAAYVATNSSRIFDAAVAATVHMGIAGEQAARGLSIDQLTGTFRSRLVDYLGLITSLDLDKEAKYEVQ